MELELKPSDIHYLSKSISAHFSNGAHVLDSFEDLLDGDLKPQDLPMITVFQKGSRWYVYDGERRLYLYRSLEKQGVVDTVKVKVEQNVNQENVKQKQTSRNGGRSVTVHGNSNFHGKHGSLIQQWSRKNTFGEWRDHDDYYFSDSDDYYCGYLSGGYEDLDDYYYDSDF